MRGGIRQSKGRERVERVVGRGVRVGERGGRGAEGALVSRLPPPLCFPQGNQPNRTPNILPPLVQKEKLKKEGKTCLYTVLSHVNEW